MAERRLVDQYHPITLDEFGDPFMLGVDNSPQGCWQALPSKVKEPGLIEYQKGKPGSLSKAVISESGQKARAEVKRASESARRTRRAAGRQR